MASWASLSASDQNEVIDLLRAARLWSSMMHRINNLGLAIAAKWSGNVESIVSSLDAGLIPPTNNIAEAEQLTKAEIQNLVGYAITCSATPDNSSGSYNTNYHRALFVRAGGLFNCLQQGNG